MSIAREKRDGNFSVLIRFATTQLAVAGWLVMTIPSADAAYNLNYYPYSYLGPGDFGACARRLLSVKVSPDAVTTACAQTLNPQTFSRCVVDIKHRTTIAAEDAVNTCSQARRPTELSTCVIGISRNSRGKADPAVLNYCGSTLLPVRFADCVVGLRRKISNLAPTQAMDSCIGATDQLFDLAPNFVPQIGTPPVSYPIRSGPENQGLPNQPTPTPATPTNPLSPAGQ